MLTEKPNHLLCSNFVDLVSGMSHLEFFSTTNPLVGPKDLKNEVLTVFGVPFDATTSYRPGTRFGPNALREAFLNVEAYSHMLKIDVEKVPIQDLGNLTRLINAEETIDMVSKVTKELFSKSKKFCMIGGEHSITYGSFKNAPKETGYIVFDAHFDLRSEWEGSKYSHACYLRRILEQRDPKLIAHIGGRAATEEEWRLSKKLGLSITAMGAEVPSSIKKYKAFLSKFEQIYLSVDLDALDPAYAPGVGTPEPAGMTTSTLLKYIYPLKDVKIIAFDIVELCPPYDNGTTTTMAARIMNELVAIIYLQSKKESSLTTRKS
jgi:agmatinase